MNPAVCMQYYAYNFIVVGKFVSRDHIAGKDGNYGCTVECNTNARKTFQLRSSIILAQYQALSVLSTVCVLNITTYLPSFTIHNEDKLQASALSAYQFKSELNLRYFVLEEISTTNQKSPFQI